LIEAELFDECLQDVSTKGSQDGSLTSGSSHGMLEKALGQFLICHPGEDNCIDKSLDDMRLSGRQIFESVIGFELIEEQFYHPACLIDSCDLRSREETLWDVSHIEVICSSFRMPDTYQSEGAFDFPAASAVDASFDFHLDLHVEDVTFEGDYCLLDLLCHHWSGTSTAVTVDFCDGRVGRILQSTDEESSISIDPIEEAVSKECQVDQQKTSRYPRPDGQKLSLILTLARKLDLCI